MWETSHTPFLEPVPEKLRRAVVHTSVVFPWVDVTVEGNARALNTRRQVLQSSREQQASLLTGAVTTRQYKAFTHTAWLLCEPATPSDLGRIGDSAASTSGSVVHGLQPGTSRNDTCSVALVPKHLAAATAASGLGSRRPAGDVSAAVTLRARVIGFEDYWSFQPELYEPIMARTAYHGRHRKHGPWRLRPLLLDVVAVSQGRFIEGHIPWATSFLGFSCVVTMSAAVLVRLTTTTLAALARGDRKKDAANRQQQHSPTPTTSSDAHTARSGAGNSDVAMPLVSRQQGQQQAGSAEPLGFPLWLATVLLASAALHHALLAECRVATQGSPTCTSAAWQLSVCAIVVVVLSGKAWDAGCWFFAILQTAHRPAAARPSSR